MNRKKVTAKNNINAIEIITSGLNIFSGLSFINLLYITKMEIINIETDSIPTGIESKSNVLLFITSYTCEQENKNNAPNINFLIKLF